MAIRGAAVARCQDEGFNGMFRYFDETGMFRFMSFVYGVGDTGVESGKSDRVNQSKDHGVLPADNRAVDQHTKNKMPNKSPKRRFRTTFICGRYWIRII